MARSADYEHPSNRRFRRLAESLANSRGIRAFRRALFTRLPFPVLESNVQDVLYLNWVVPLPLSKADLPPGVSVWERGQSTILTVLIYRHGHFGPVFLGPLRRLFPSPLQSNWRLYVTRVEGEDPTHSMVLFLRNFFSSALYAIGTRLGSDALPSEQPCAFTFQTESELCANIIGASGELELQVAGSVGGRPALPHPFQAFAASWKEAVTALTLQESAIVQPPDLTCLAQAGISLPVDIAEVRPVVITHWKAGNWLTARGATGEPFAFFVPRVRFRVLWEKLVTSANNSFKGMPLRGTP